jgi:hypothetical protein
MITSLRSCGNFEAANTQIAQVSFIFLLARRFVQILLQEYLSFFTDFKTFMTGYRYKKHHLFAQRTSYAAERVI